MHVHQSLWKDGQPLFFGDGYANLSQTAMWYMGGILKHAASLLAFTNPTTNSYRRLVPGYEAPVNLVYSNRNRSAAIRIPVYSNNPKTKRVEVRFPDPAANCYYALPAMMLAGLDGIENQIDPGDPGDVDLYEEDIGTPVVPGNLGAVLDALQDDHDYLLKGGVFTEDIIQSYIEYKRVEEADAVAMAAASLRVPALPRLLDFPGRPTHRGRPLRALPFCCCISCNSHFRFAGAAARLQVSRLRLPCRCVRDATHGAWLPCRP